MSKPIEYEPFLTDYNCAFHGIFILTDPAMNTSEIKPLHLAIPRNSQGVRRASHTQPNVNGVPGVSNESKPEKKSPQRFLSQRYLKKSENPAPAAAPAPAVKTPVGPQKPIQTEADKQTEQQMNALLQKVDFWLYPLSSSFVAKFVCMLDTRSGYSLHMFTENSNIPILTAKTTGMSRSSTLEFFYGKQLIGESRYNARNSSFFVGIDIPNKGRCEACAAIFNPSFSSARQPRIFDFVIPALKKIEGTNRMVPVMFSETSTLVAMLSRMAKEAIRVRTRVPNNGASGEWDMTFDGKFEVSAYSNFVIYHDSNINRNLCAFGMRKDGKFMLEIGYPMSPIQAFIAAVAATLPA